MELDNPREPLTPAQQRLLASHGLQIDRPATIQAFRSARDFRQGCGRFLNHFLPPTHWIGRSYASTAVYRRFALLFPGALSQACRSVTHQEPVVQVRDDAWPLLWQIYQAMSRLVDVEDPAEPGRQGPVPRDYLLH